MLFVRGLADVSRRAKQRDLLLSLHLLFKL
jgi:hypothetical protein